MVDQYERHEMPAPPVPMSRAERVIWITLGAVAVSLILVSVVFTEDWRVRKWVEWLWLMLTETNS